MNRQRAERHGRTAERIAALFLQLKGYRILARRWKSPAGEIDLIAQQGRTLVCIEVKFRRTRNEALAAISLRQQARIVRAAHIYQAAHPALCAAGVRCDALCLAPWRMPLHIVNAFSE